MKEAHPPTGLPADFASVWRAVSEAADRAPSRQALARELGVSTATLHRILVSGEVPIFTRLRNRRVLHAWTRTLTRLAVHFGREPRAWLEHAGIGWDEAIQRVVESVRTKRPARDRRPPASRRRQPPRISPVWPPTGRVGAPLRAGLAHHPVLSETLPGNPESFLEQYARRLLGAVDPSAAIHTRLLDEPEILASLTSPRPGLQLGVGVVETVERWRRGIGFVHLPGWRVRLGALCVHDTRRPRPAPTWRQAISSAAGDHFRFVVPQHHVAHAFLRGQCAVPADRIIACEAPHPDALAGALRKASHPVILISDAATCLQTLQVLEDDAEIAAALVPGDPKEFPSYPLAVAFPSRSGVRRLLRAATDRELFDNTYPQTAQLYAELLAAIALRDDSVDLAGSTRRTWAWAMHDFAHARTAFREALGVHLLNTLATHLPVVLKARGVTADPGYAIGVAITLAQQLLPPAWKTELETAVTQARSLAASALRSRHCHSCSAALTEPHNRGVSDRYCRYCADEHGRLKSRDEVSRLIAEWFQHWQGEVAPEEMRRRAKLYMQAMPAWN